MALIFVYKTFPLIVAASYIILLFLVFTPQLHRGGISAVSVRNIYKYIAIPASVFLSVTIFRKIINSKRPYEVYCIKPIVSKSKKGESFPSRHASCSMIIAFAWLYFCPVAAIVIFIMSVFIAMSRVLAGVHMFKDVIFGMFFSCVFGVFGLFL